MYYFCHGKLSSLGFFDRGLFQMTISEITMVPLDSGNFSFPLLFSILIFSSRSIIPSIVGVGSDIAPHLVQNPPPFHVFNSISIHVDNRSSLTITTLNQPLYFPFSSFSLHIPLMTVFSFYLRRGFEGFGNSSDLQPFLFSDMRIWI